MNIKRIAAGFAAAVLMCGLSVSSVYAAGPSGRRGGGTSGNRPENITPAPGSYQLKTEKLTAEGTKPMPKDGFTYGDTILLTMTYYPKLGEDLTNQPVSFTIPDPNPQPQPDPAPQPADLADPLAGGDPVPPADPRLSLGTVNFSKAKDGSFQAMLQYDTRIKALNLGSTPVRAEFPKPHYIDGQTLSREVSVPIVPMPLKGVWTEIPTYNGTSQYDNMPIGLHGVWEQMSSTGNAEPVFEDVTAQGNVQLKSKDAGKPGEDNVAKVDQIQLSGADAGWYTLQEKDISKKMTIGKAPLHVDAVTAASKQFDATNLAQLDSITVSGLQGSDAVAMEQVGYQAYFTGALASDADQEVKASGFYLLDSTLDRNYYIDNPNEEKTAIAKINRRPLTMENFVIYEKTYDGSTDAQLKNVNFTGLQWGEQLVLGEDYQATASFDSAAAGENKTITLNGLTLMETPKTQNYVLEASPNSTQPGRILKKPLDAGMISGLPEGLRYDGAAKKPEITVSDKSGETELISTKDYEVQYGENILPEKGTVTITASPEGNYQGTASASFDILKGQTTVAPSIERVVYEDGHGGLRFWGRFTKAGDQTVMPTGSATVVLEDGTTSSGLIQEDGSVEIYLPDLAGKDRCSYHVEYAGDANYEPMTSAALSSKLNPLPVPTATPAPSAKPSAKPQASATPAPTPSATPKGFDWYGPLNKIKEAKSGSVTIDVGNENAVPHFIWQAFYDKDITVTMHRGSTDYVFNGKDLKRSGFDPDNGHNLSDLSRYIKNSSTPVPAAPSATETPEPQATAVPSESTETPKATPSAAPSEQPSAEPSSDPEEKPAESSEPEESAIPANKAESEKDSYNWLYWVMGISAAIAVVLIVILLIQRKKERRRERE